jgi:hypothetical protein
VTFLSGSSSTTIADCDIRYELENNGSRKTAIRKSKQEVVGIKDMPKGK